MHEAETRRDHGSGAAEAEFYVGYLPMPMRLARFVRLTLVLLFALCSGASMLLARYHANPGSGSWNTAEVATFEGVIEAAPYAMLRTNPSPEGPAEALLIVEVGKHGGGARALPHAGRGVRVRGWLLEREGRRMIELEPGDGAIVPLVDYAAAKRLASEDVDLGTVTLRGEIVDSKCFLGAMKPGEGKTHKECAALCIRGGIPAMLVTRDGTGASSCYLLADATGAAAPAAVLPLVGEPVQVTGRLVRRDGLLILRLDRNSFQRI